MAKTDALTVADIPLTQTEIDLLPTKDKNSASNRLAKLEPLLIKPANRRLQTEKADIINLMRELNDYKEVLISQGKIGKGLSLGGNLSQYEQPLVNNKYFINRKKLNANVLEIRYTKNRHLIPIKSQIVGKKLRLIIETIIDNNHLDKKQYEQLTKMEQNLLRSLLPYLGRDIDDVDDDEAFYDRFDVIRGELLSGNDNRALKREAKQYLMHALNTGKISRTHFNQMLIDLDL